MGVPRLWGESGGQLPAHTPTTPPQKLRPTQGIQESPGQGTTPLHSNDNARFLTSRPLGNSSAAILNVSFLSSLTTESSMASSPVHTFSSHLTWPYLHPFCLSVPDFSSFSGLPWTWRSSFSGSLSFLDVSIRNITASLMGHTVSLAWQ